jgi:hypothetical protein
MDFIFFKKHIFLIFLIFVINDKNIFIIIYLKINLM